MPLYELGCTADHQSYAASGEYSNYVHQRYNLMVYPHPPVKIASPDRYHHFPRSNTGAGSASAFTQPTSVLAF